MASINLASLTIPTPQPYDDKFDQRQQENLAYVLLQLLIVGQAAGFKIPDKDEISLLTEKIEALTTAVTNLSLTVTPTDMTELTQAVKDLQFKGWEIDTGFVRIGPYGLLDEA